MKFYSELLKKTFDSAEECVKAEQRVSKKESSNTSTKNIDDANSVKSKDRDILRNKIEEADKVCGDAYAEYIEAKKKAVKIISEAKKQASDIIREANEKSGNIIKEAATKLNASETNRTKLIEEYSKLYGPYTVVHSGCNPYFIRSMFDPTMYISKLYNLFD